MTRIAILAGAWLVWFLGLTALGKGHRQPAVRKDPKARWGLALQMTGYCIVNVHTPDFWKSELPMWRAIAAVAFALISIAIFRSAVASLGPQWRFDAALNRDHELVQTGAYRLVRHPIYASMLGMFLMDVWLAGTLPGWPIAFILFVAGTEIRVRIEDALLRERFGERFIAWRRSVPAYVPFVR